MDLLNEQLSLLKDNKGKCLIKRSFIYCCILIELLRSKNESLEEQLRDKEGI